MSTVRFLADHDLNEHIVEGVRRREPGIGIGDTALSQYQEVKTSRRPCLDSTTIRRNPLIFNGLWTQFGYADSRSSIEVQCPDCRVG